jgi:hypothetical protein
VRMMLRSLLQPAAVVLLTVFFGQFLHRISSRRAQAEKWSNQMTNQVGAWLVVSITLIELTILGTHWVSSVNAPELSRQNETEKEAPLVWANLANADLKLLEKNTPRTVSPTQELQHIFLQGKLNLVAGVAALHASGTIEPQSLLVLRRWLSARDDLSASQPELDRLLAELGVNKRLIVDELGKLSWKSVENAKPLCELIPKDTLDQGPSRVKWQWINNSHLTIELNCTESCYLLIRQFNDERWKIQCESIKDPQIQSGELFVVGTVPPGKHTILLSR